MKYLRKHKLHSEFLSLKNSLDKPNVSWCLDDEYVHYLPKKELHITNSGSYTDTGFVTLEYDTVGTFDEPIIWSHNLGDIAVIENNILRFFGSLCW